MDRLILTVNMLQMIFQDCMTRDFLWSALGTFFRCFRKICITRSFPMKKFERRDTSRLHSYIDLYWPLTSTKKINQQHLNHRLFFLQFLWFSPSPRLYAQVDKRYLGIHCQTGIYSEWICQVSVNGYKKWSKMVHIGPKYSIMVQYDPK